MTLLNRTVRRETCAGTYSGGKFRPIIVTLDPPGNVIGFRLKGTRRTYYLPVGKCFLEASRIAHAHEVAERKKQRQLERQAARR